MTVAMPRSLHSSHMNGSCSPSYPGLLYPHPRTPLFFPPSYTRISSLHELSILTHTRDIFTHPHSYHRLFEPRSRKYMTIIGFLPFQYGRPCTGIKFAYFLARDASHVTFSCYAYFFLFIYFFLVLFIHYYIRTFHSYFFFKHGSLNYNEEKARLLSDYIMKSEATVKGALSQCSTLFPYQ